MTDLLPDDPELRALIAALRRWSGLRDFPAQPLDHDRLLALAARQGLIGVLAAAWPAAEVSTGAERARFIIEATITNNGRRNRALRTTAAQVARTLDMAGIPNLVLKGLAFIAEDDACAPWRMVSDIDVLVAPESLMAAADVLLAAGFTATTEVERYRPADHQHFSPLIAGESGHMVELHARLIWDSTRDPVPAENLLAERAPSPTTGGVLQLPSPTHRMIHLIAHGQIGDRNYAAGQISLKDVADFVVLTRRFSIDWTAVKSRLTAAGSGAELRGFLAAADLILGHDFTAGAIASRDARPWARRAIAELANPGAGRARLLLHLAADYARQVLRQPAKLSLVMKTLLDRDRRASFFGTQYRRWRR